MPNNIIVLWGISGSGKTTYGRKLSTYRHTFIDGDKQNLDKVVEKVKRQLGPDGQVLNNKDVVVDTQISTNAELEKFVAHFPNTPIKVICWRENRTACLKNDTLRPKDRQAHITIKNKPFELPNWPDVEYKEVEHKPWWGLVDDHRVKDGKLIGDSWSNGGTYGSCWDKPGDEKTQIGPDSPKEFVEFDELMEKINPDIGFLKYKNLRNKTCEIVTKYDGDYYGGSWSDSHWECDLNKLFQLIG